MKHFFFLVALLSAVPCFSNNDGTEITLIETSKAGWGTDLKDQLRQKKPCLLHMNVKSEDENDRVSGFIKGVLQQLPEGCTYAERSYAAGEGHFIIFAFDKSRDEMMKMLDGAREALFPKVFEQKEGEGRTPPPRSKRKKR